jgi:hypothetical protein
MPEDIKLRLSAARARRSANPNTETPAGVATPRPLRSGLFSSRSRLEPPANANAAATAQPLEPTANNATTAAAQTPEPAAQLEQRRQALQMQLLLAALQQQMQQALQALQQLQGNVGTLISRLDAVEESMHQRVATITGRLDAAEELQERQQGNNTDWSVEASAIKGGGRRMATDGSNPRTSSAGPDRRASAATAAEAIAHLGSYTDADGIESAVSTKPTETITEAPGPVLHLLRAMLAKIKPPYHQHQSSATKGAETANKALSGVDPKLAAAITSELEQRRQALSAANELDRATIVRVIEIANYMEVSNPLLIGKILAESIRQMLPECAIAKSYRIKYQHTTPNVLDLFGLARVSDVTSTKSDDQAIKKVNQFNHKARDSPAHFVSNFFDAAAHMVENVVNTVARDKAISGLPETLRRNANNHLQRVILSSLTTQPKDYQAGDDATTYISELRTWAAAVADESQQILDSLKDARRAIGASNGGDDDGGGGDGAEQPRDHPRGAGNDTTTGNNNNDNNNKYHHPRGTGNDVAANTTTNNNNNKHKTQADADFTDMSRPCLRTRCRVSEPHNNGGVAECQYWCRDPSCAQARTRHMRLYEGHAGPGQTPCVPS